MEKRRLVMIGGVAAGMSAASKARSLDPEAEIIVFEKSGYVSYIACGMPYLISGKVQSADSLIVYDARFFKEKRNIDVFLHHEALKIFPSSKTVRVLNILTGEEKNYPYDKLLISTGARPFLPPFKGYGLKGIFTLRLLEEGREMLDYIKQNSPLRGLIIGAGSIGMEMAEAFTVRGLDVTIVEKMPSILGSMDIEINELVETELSRHGVKLIKSMSVIEFVGEGDRIKKVILENGESIEADIVLIGAGIRPNSEIGAEAGIELGFGNAIKVNERMETNLPDIFAAGDCAETYHLIYSRNMYFPQGTTANRQGRVAGENMIGGRATFSGVAGTSVFKVFDLEVGRTGLSEKDVQAEKIDCVAEVIEHVSRAHYYPGVEPIRAKLVADRSTGRLLGAQMVGKEGVAMRIDIFATALTAGMTAREVSMLDLGYSPPLAPANDSVIIAAGQLQKKIT